MSPKNWSVIEPELEPSRLREFLLPTPGPAAGESPATPRVAPLRVIGPGRFERGYLQRLSGLAAELEVVRERERRLAESMRESSAALEVSQRVERGCQRHIDRLEQRLESRTQALLESERAHKRLALAIGALQRENELLRERATAALAAAPQTGRDDGRPAALGPGDGARARATRPWTRWFSRG